jgi:hypothetical protein
MVDTDSSGVIDVEEIFAARQNRAARMFVEQSNSTALSFLFEGSKWRLTRRLKPFVNKAGQIDRASWDK